MTQTDDLNASLPGTIKVFPAAGLFYCLIKQPLVSAEKAMAPHSSVLAWRIPGTGEPGGGHLWGHTESDTTEVT